MARKILITSAMRAGWRPFSGSSTSSRDAGCKCLSAAKAIVEESFTHTVRADTRATLELDLELDGARRDSFDPEPFDGLEAPPDIIDDSRKDIVLQISQREVDPGKAEASFVNEFDGSDFWNQAARPTKRVWIEANESRSG